MAESGDSSMNDQLSTAQSKIKSEPKKKNEGGNHKETAETDSHSKERGDGPQSDPKKDDKNEPRPKEGEKSKQEETEKEKQKVKQEDVQDGIQDDKRDNKEPSESKEMTQKTRDTDSKTKEHGDGPQSHQKSTTKVDTERVNRNEQRPEGLYGEKEQAKQEKAHDEQEDEQDDEQDDLQEDEREDIQAYEQEDIESNKRKEEMFRRILYGLAVVFAFFAVVYMLSYSTPPVQKDVNVVDAFNERMAKVKSDFPNQRPELWKRSRIHISRHLKTVNPTEPVSLILTSGRGAEKTLGCLARRLAEAFSGALNSSVLNIYGKSKASEDSDKVKLDIDSDLRNAFGGKMLAAVIHRFEELPPGSTLIFYRYCDHENAAYKKVFLVFTVMLDSEEEVPSNASLARVEDMVHEQIKRKFVSSDKSAVFNQMDVDKLSGLWSRISHLILPVAGEEMIEQQGCEA